MVAFAVTPFGRSGSFSDGSLSELRFRARKMVSAIVTPVLIANTHALAMMRAMGSYGSYAPFFASTTSFTLRPAAVPRAPAETPAITTGTIWFFDRNAASRKMAAAMRQSPTVGSSVYALTKEAPVISATAAAPVQPTMNLHVGLKFLYSL